MDDTPSQGSDQGPTPPDDAAPTNKGGSSSERKLIEAAFEGAQPASGWPETSTAWFEGAPLPPHGAFPGYDIVREIHRGGQGVVYQAVQLSTRRHVAIKVMHSGPFMGSSGRARFEREVQVLGQLDHPNIVGIHDSGVTKDGSCFYVMDYISGKPLDKLLAEGQLPIRESLKLFAKICDAVNAAHLKGVIHRDLKPANIRIDKHGEPIVVDFGLAKLAIPDLDEEGSGKLMSMTGQFIGSLPWASPEQAEGSPSNIDVRTDVYSLGVILYQLLTNRFPYEVLGNMRDVLDNIVRAEPARPSTIRRKINDEVETIVLKSLSKQRERRYQSAGELGRDVHRFLEGQPIEAKRDSGWYVITKTLKRYQAPVAVAGGSLVALIVFAVVITVLYEDAKTARGIAEQETIAANLARSAEAEQRQLAESRLENAYDLTGTMLTDFYDAIRDLRGATAAKLALAENAVATLDGLEAEAEGDPQRLLLIGRGRLRLGMLYAGRAEFHRVGRPDEGPALYESALAIADGLIAEGASLTEARVLRARTLAAISHARRLQKDYLGSSKAIDEAIDEADRALRLVGPDSELRANIEYLRADSMLERGNTQVERGMAVASTDEATAREIAQRARDAFEQAQRAFQSMIDRTVDVDRGELGVSRALVRLAEWTIRSVTFDNAQLESVDHQEMLDRLDRAMALLDRAVALIEGLETRDPKSAVYPRDRLMADEGWAKAMRVRGAQLDALAEQQPERSEELARDAKEARQQSISMLEDAVARGQQAFNADEANVTLARRLAMLTGQLGQSYQEAGQLDNARRKFDESIHLREASAAIDPTSQHFNDAVVGWYRLGVFHERRAGEPDPSQDELRAALDAFTKAREFAEKQIELGIPPDNTHLEDVQDLIDGVRARMSAG
ncbi:MAG: protein kinase [Phycisphaera sp.]|nr:MAG: protein kinase [Phycisphaera sp.]